MAAASSDLHTESSLRQGQMIWEYDPQHDVATLEYKNLILESEADVAWFERQCDAFWKRFREARRERVHIKRDLLVNLGGIVVKPAVAAAWNAVRARMAEKYLRKTYRYGGERRTVTAIHLGEVLQKMEGMIYHDRDDALTALLADRLTEKGH